jgi:hypothetical protein
MCAMALLRSVAIEVHNPPIVLLASVELEVHLRYTIRFMTFHRAPVPEVHNPF